MYRRDNGVGVLFVKTGDNEITEIEFVLGRNGKFGTLNGTLLAERLNELSKELMKRQNEERVEYQEQVKEWVTDYQGDSQ